jgi:hypothetical protein
MTKTMFLLWVPVAHHVLPDSQAVNASRYDWGYLSSPNGPFLPDGTIDYTAFVALGDRLRELNPKHKTGWFMGGVAAQRTMDMAYPWIRDDCMLHFPDGRPVEKPDPGKLINWMRDTVAWDMADQYATFLREKGWSGIAADSFAPNEWAAHVRNMGQEWYGNPEIGCLEGPAHRTEWWEEALTTSTERIRYRLEEEGLTFIVNGIAPGEMHGALGMARVNAADCSSGMLYEMGHKAKANPTYLQSMLDAVTAVTAKRREVHWFVLPRVASLTGDPPPDERNSGLTDHRLHFATYLLAHEPPYTHYGLHPYTPYYAWDVYSEPLELKIHWEDDWHHIRELGSPLGRYQRVSEMVWVRHFARGFVVVNASNGHGEYHWAGIGRLWDRWSGRVIDTREGGLLMVDPFQGWLIWTG